MPSILTPPRWRIPDREATPESVYRNRRAFLKDLGILGLGAIGLASGVGRALAAGGDADLPNKIDNYDHGTLDLYPARRNPAFTLDRALTHEDVAATYNNFYEFTEVKSDVWKLVGKFQVRPWMVEIGGLCEKPGTYDVYDLIRKFPLEERLYRHRCVEAWAMAVPWTGFPLRKLIDFAGVKDDAKFVRFVSFMKPGEAPNENPRSGYTWPYFEALRMDEAMNDLALIGTGIYGHPLPKQHGAPFRLITPWKYGFKSAKSIVKIDFVEKQPPTFWSSAVPSEYHFLANVNPNKPHPRWSQATERLIGIDKTVPTQMYNGYGEWVAKLYA